MRAQPGGKVGMSIAPGEPGTQDLPPATQVRTIACLMLNGIGDIVCVSPVFEALKRRYPAARLTIIMRLHLRGLVEGSAFVDDVLFYETARPWQRLVFLARANRRRFDLWVDLHVPTFNTMSSNRRDFLRNAWLLRVARPRFAVAYATPELRSLLSHPVPVPSAHDLRTTSIVRTTLDIVTRGAAARFGKHVPVTAIEREWAERALPGGDTLRIGLFFGSRQPADLWPAGKVLEFVAMLGTRLPGAEIVLIGGEHESATASVLAAAVARAGLRLHDFVCKVGLGQTAALLARCTVFVSTDSGPMHIADAMGVPMVALFSSKNYPAIWRPVHARTELINHAVDCGPCFRASCNIGNKCMQMIEPTEVLDALLRLLHFSRAAVATDTVATGEERVPRALPGG